MADRKDVIAWKKSPNGKSYPVRCGSAVPGEAGEWRLYLDAIPAPEDGQYRLSIVTPRERGNGPQRGSEVRAAPRSRADDDYDAPF